MRFCAFICLLLVVSMFGAVVPRAGAQDAAAADVKTLKEAGQAVETPALLEFFRKRTLTDVSQEKIQTLIRQLGDNAYKVRAKATADLIALGSVAIPFLRQARHNSDLEVSRRAEECLSHISEGEARIGLLEAAVRVLAQRKAAGAAEVLLAYEPFAPDEVVAGEVQSALVALALSDGKPEKALRDGLNDKLPERRAVAAEA